ncbi:MULTISPECIES: ABC transporter ATP-binding protein [Micrococcaceae]|uniref:ABC transporter ATP-binding protein n=1 Tax=Micrococcaceae TaxID=1268 RepID=UPI000CFD072C|nr:MULTISPECIES: ABC transporter ATP-binding protein [unclassified Arthrobacter]MCS3492290.1 putative ABC transport system ATP-binding protein [Arthrobacter sp. JUb119]PQZ87805.1 ABC transporter [Arthrobacter sp. MYb222]TDU30612.1 putative ABC transport system ATP-binding protein [Arthrobacter sp. JUb115]
MTSETLPKTENAVAARGLTKTYGHDSTRVEALRDVNVSFERSRFTAIMGPSGSGKSTLMHCLAGLDTADSGEIIIGGKNLLELSDDQLTEMRREQIGFVFQSFNLVPTITAKDNILLPLSLAGKKHDRDWFNTVIQALGLGDRLNHKPHELSGGQQQRVAVARALLTRPEVVFGDEPTGNLDSRTGAEVLSLMRTSTREMGQTIIMVTHDPVAASYADNVLLMKDGTIVGSIQEPTVATVTEALASLAE